jgi:hypothetical protein
MYAAQNHFFAKRTQNTGSARATTRGQALRSVQGYDGNTRTQACNGCEMLSISAFNGATVLWNAAEKNRIEPNSRNSGSTNG